MIQGVFTLFAFIPPSLAHSSSMTVCQLDLPISVLHGELREVLAEVGTW